MKAIVERDQKWLELGAGNKNGTSSMGQERDERRGGRKKENGPLMVYLRSRR